MEDTGESRAGKGPRVASGPIRWDEVDTEELERIALAIARNAMPQNSENSDIAARMAAQAAALQMDQQDILGLGRIDTQNCSLVSSTARPRLRLCRCPLLQASMNRGRRKTC